MKFSKKLREKIVGRMLRPTTKAVFLVGCPLCDSFSAIAWLGGENGCLHTHGEQLAVVQFYPPFCLPMGQRWGGGRQCPCTQIGKQKEGWQMPNNPYPVDQKKYTGPGTFSKVKSTQITHTDALSLNFERQRTQPV